MIEQMISSEGLIFQLCNSKHKSYHLNLNPQGLSSKLYSFQFTSKLRDNADPTIITDKEVGIVYPYLSKRSQIEYILFMS